MAAFTPVASISTSADGLTQTFLDASIYGTNDEGYQPTDFTRSFVLTDAYGNPLATIPMTGSVLTAPYAITADLWIVGELVLVGHGGYTDTIKVACDRITKNLYRVMLQQGCCSNQVIDKRLEIALEYLKGCEIETLSGNGAGFDVDIAAAYSILTGPKF